MKLFDVIIKDGSIKLTEAENILEALNYMVKIEGVHPSKIKAITESFQKEEF